MRKGNHKVSLEEAKVNIRAASVNVQVTPVLSKNVGPLALAGFAAGVIAAESLKYGWKVACLALDVAIRRAKKRK